MMNKKPMERNEDLELFGPASNYETVQEAINFLCDLVGEEAKTTTIAYIMLLAARTIEGNNYRAGTLAVLNKLAFTKAELDSAMCHTHPTIDVTGDILLSAQKFVDEATIPCTEWPTSDELVEKISVETKKYSGAKKWEKIIRNEKGVVIGIEPILGI